MTLSVVVESRCREMLGGGVCRIAPWQQKERREGQNLSRVLKHAASWERSTKWRAGEACAASCES